MSIPLARKAILALSALLLLSACFEDAVVERPVPINLGTEDVGYFCSMNINEHSGPRAQVHLEGLAKPLWFPQVRDMFGYVMLPGENKRIAALYVTDMSGKTDWNDTDNGPWIDAKTASFVINSKRGGMGALETIPFSNRKDAEAFTQQYGGDVVAYDEISVDYVFSGSSGPISPSK